MDVERRNPRCLFYKLHRGSAGIEANDQRDRNDQARKRTRQRQPTGKRCIFVGTGGEHNHTRKNGYPDDEGKYGIHGSVQPGKPGDQGKYPDQHGESVMVDVAGLEGAHQPGCALDQPRGAVDRQPSMIA